MTRLAALALSLALTCAGCTSASRSPATELTHVTPPLAAPPYGRLALFAPDGTPLTADEAARFEDGFVFVPAAGDAGSAGGLGEWYEYQRAQRVAGPEREMPEPVRRHWEAR